MITELTSEQKTLLQQYAEEWQSIGYNTQPASHLDAEKGVRLAYEASGIALPYKIMWFESPMAMAVSELIIENATAEVEPIIYEMPIAKVRQEINQHLSGTVIDDIGNIIYAEELFLGLHRSQAFINLAISRYIRNNIVRHQSRYIQAMRWYTIYGQHSAAFDHSTSQYHSSARLINLTKSLAAMNGIYCVAQNAGRWLPYKGICLISERTNIWKFDESGLPHCEDGLAIGYPDGWGIYAWHGQMIPEYAITTNLSPDRIMSESNAEVAWVMIERYGRDSFIRDGGFSKVQSDDYGDLYRIEFKTGDEPIVALHVQDASTDRDYFLYVPSHIRTAHEGVAWTFDNDNVTDYNSDHKT